ncbi:NAD-dependent epimerase/dehydratase family protein [Litoribacter ruber]|uniref:NAD-dependent epimerase/dehydratase family protein n=1 Tax=Litoribacter ruber TaxID=702568 RepID=UPI001BDA2FE9|nr:NAD-dependent epimerase/dehydratase family protein [Litoribacter ruber]MBT0811268.1 NAD-dependent epimerase/dehydratase family protein [Litoribacter ruber]
MLKRIAIVAGGSGLVGMQLLHQLFQHKEYDAVIAIGRRHLALKHPKLAQIEVDFAKLDRCDLVEGLRIDDFGGENQQIIEALENQSCEIHAFCSLGTTIKKAGSKDAFFKIDHDFVINFAKWTYKIGARKFLYVSAIGADQQSSFFYNKVKGQVEEDLKLIKFDYLGIFQPSILLGQRKEVRVGEDVGKVIMKAFTTVGLFRKYKPIQDSQVARAMIHHALKQPKLVVEYISSKAMQALQKD